MENEVNDIRTIMTKHFAGETSSADEKVLANWINASAENKSEYKKSKELFEAATRHYKKTIVPDIDVEAEWKVFQHKVAEERPVVKMTPAFSFMKIAASILLLLASGAIIYYYANKTESITFQTTASLQTVTLPDGSTIILNRNSQIKYSSDFGDKNRNIELRGEAFFNVTKNASLPFKISARNTTIEVVGTSFNVLAYDSVSEVEVIVKTGIVRFTVSGLSKTVELTPGERGVFATAQNDLHETINENINYQAWNTQQLTFAEAHLSEVVEAINKAYNANIIVSGPVSDSCLLTVSFDNQSLDAVLNVLQSTLNLTYDRVGDRIEITSTGC